ncbi:bacteriohemerythrin [Variovorax sp. AB1(2024)]|uniref:bacteriohemerythrin n=1 Tax=unclassified Variovorax TaxID=663243 RepID=UPI002556A1F2|nr:bacteriohemerythrin [Variovorax sp. efr-133-TYG-130]
MIWINGVQAGRTDTDRSNCNSSLEVMAHLVWKTELDTGIREIDTQHQRIVQYINALGDAKLTDDQRAVGKIIDEAIDYTASHFAFEEAMIEDAGYSFVGPHRKVHEIFVRRVVEFRTRFERGEDVLAELHDMLSRWLFNHIRHEDGAYVPAVKAHLEVTGSTAERIVKAQASKELAQGRAGGQIKQGWLKRLFAG